MLAQVGARTERSPTLNDSKNPSHSNRKTTPASPDDPRLIATDPKIVALVDAMYRDRCTRFPCFAAYRYNGVHEPEADGTILHLARAASETRRDDNGELIDVWSVSAVATDDEPWKLFVAFEGTGHIFSGPPESQNFEEAVTKAVRWAADANVREGGHG
jgi:hypothetical protein